MAGCADPEAVAWTSDIRAGPWRLTWERSLVPDTGTVRIDAHLEKLRKKRRK